MQKKEIRFAVDAKSLHDATARVCDVVSEKSMRATRPKAHEEVRAQYPDEKPFSPISLLLL